MLLIAGRFPELVSRIDQVCTQYASDFEANKATYVRQDGYNLRLESARLALLRLEQIAHSRGDAQMAETYRKGYAQYERERDDLANDKRW